MGKKKSKSLYEEVLKEFGEDAVIKKYDPETGPPSIPTGSLAIDVSTGIGGIPLGRVTMIYGPEQGGKTTLCLAISKNALDLGLKVLLVDTENSLDYGYINEIVGEYDENDFVIVQPRTAEDAFMVAEAGISSEFDVIIFDSIASVSPEEEIEKPFTKDSMMVGPRLNGRFLRRNIHEIKNKNIAFVFTNQVRANVGSYFGGYSTPGGYALEHYTSLRIYLSKSKSIDEGDEQIGHYVNFNIKKNKVGKPHRQATTNLIYGKGIDFERDVISFGNLLGAIKNRGSYFGYEGDTIGSKPGVTNTAEYLKEDKELLDKIVDSCYNIAGSRKNHITRKEEINENSESDN
jgi:recombination protein RecA